MLCTSGFVDDVMCMRHQRGYSVTAQRGQQIASSRVWLAAGSTRAWRRLKMDNLKMHDLKMTDKIAKNIRVWKTTDCKMTVLHGRR